MDTAATHKIPRAVSEKVFGYNSYDCGHFGVAVSWEFIFHAAHPQLCSSLGRCIPCTRTDALPLLLACKLLSNLGVMDDTLQDDL